MYFEDPSKGFPTNKPCGSGAGCPVLLQEEHTKFILAFFGEEPEKEMHLLQDAIKDKFRFEVSESTLYWHVKKKCSLSLQHLQLQPVAWFSDGNKQARKVWVEQWQSGETFMQKSVFIDEAGFNMYQQCLSGWVPRGGKKSKAEAGSNNNSNVKDNDSDQPQKVKRSATRKVPRIKSINFSVIGAICWSGVINMVLRTPPQAPAPRKKRTLSGRNKVEDDEEQEQS